MKHGSKLRQARSILVINALRTYGPMDTSAICMRVALTRKQFDRLRLSDEWHDECAKAHVAVHPPIYGDGYIYEASGSYQLRELRRLVQRCKVKATMARRDEQRAATMYDNILAVLGPHHADTAFARSVWAAEERSVIAADVRVDDAERALATLTAPVPVAVP